MKEIKNVAKCSDETLAKASIEYDALIKELKAKKEMIDKELKSRHSHFDFAYNGHTVTIRTYAERRFNASLFQQKHAELYEAFREEKEQKKLSVNTLKNNK